MWQNTKYYVFGQVCREKNSVWILGYISKEEFLKYNDFVKKGEVKPGDTQIDKRTGKIHVAIDDCHCLRTMYLKPMKDFLNEVNNRL